jgi:DNA (cytosine-5)-methyltransferase 1
VLNAKDYGVPQNRDRIFLVSILDEHPKFYFPKPFPLSLKLKDVLETEVEEKYYLSDTIVKGFEAHRKRMEERGNGFGFKPTDGNVIASSVLTHSGSRPDDNYIIEKDPGQMEMFYTESEPLNPAEL